MLAVIMSVMTACSGGDEKEKEEASGKAVTTEPEKKPKETKASPSNKTSVKEVSPAVTGSAVPNTDVIKTVKTPDGKTISFAKMATVVGVEENRQLQRNLNFVRQKIQDAAALKKEYEGGVDSASQEQLKKEYDLTIDPKKRAELKAKMEVKNDSSVDPKRRAELKSKLDKAEAELMEYNKKLIDVYRISASRNYVIVPEKSELYIQATEEELQKLQAENKRTQTDSAKKIK